MWMLRDEPSEAGDFWKWILLGAGLALVAGALSCLAAVGRGSALGRTAGAWGCVVAAFPLVWVPVQVKVEILDVRLPEGVDLGMGGALHLAIGAAALLLGAGVLALVSDHRARA